MSLKQIKEKHNHYKEFVERFKAIEEKYDIRFIVKYNYKAQTDLKVYLMDNNSHDKFLIDSINDSYEDGAFIEMSSFEQVKFFNKDIKKDIYDLCESMDLHKFVYFNNEEKEEEDDCYSKFKVRRYTIGSKRIKSGANLTDLMTTYFTKDVEWALNYNVLRWDSDNALEGDNAIKSVPTVNNKKILYYYYDGLWIENYVYVDDIQSLKSIREVVEDWLLPNAKLYTMEGEERRYFERDGKYLHKDEQDMLMKKHNAYWVKFKIDDEVVFMGMANGAVK